MMTKDRFEEIADSGHRPLNPYFNELVAEVRRLRGVLLSIADHKLSEDAGQARDDGHEMRLIAREALGQD